MDKKRLMIVGGIVAIVAGYFLFFRKKSENGGSAGMMENGTSPSTTARGTIHGGPAKGGGAGNWIGINKYDDRKAITGVLFVGDTIQVGGQTCTVSKLWTDANGMTGAIRCQEIAKGDYNFPEGTKITY